MEELITATPDLLNGEPIEKKKVIKAAFEKTYALDEKLYGLLKNDEAFYQRADPLRHPLIFYLGHTAVFYINKLILAGLIDQRINPHFESIFAIGVDEMSWDDLNEQHYNWPAVHEVWEYRKQVKELLLSVIEDTPLHLPIDWSNPFWIIMMGIEHERIHIETSSVLIRQLPLSMVRQGAFGAVCEAAGVAPENEFLPLEGGVVKLGKAYDHRFYGWDNEYGSFEEKVPPFKAGKMLVSNGEFLQFIQHKGYRQQKYWTEEGWAWCTYEKATMPRFWRKNETTYALRLVDREIDMPWNWPVEVNYLEAKAFANWKSEQCGATFRLPTEAEWQLMAQQNNVSDKEVMVDKGNIGLLGFASPCPVDRHRHGDFYDLAGNVWQWTETPITGFPGFKVHPMYDDFSTPTFDAKHNLIKGGSWISTGNEATFHARYAFRRHFYQHAGFRLVQSEFPPEIREDVYESDEEVARACVFDYAEPPSPFVNHPKEMAQLLIALLKDKKDANVLDLNSNTGRCVFELAAHVQSVTGLDFSARFVKMATAMNERGFVRFISRDENELVHYNDISLVDLGLQQTDNIRFMQADANNLKSIYRAYDLILADQLLEELYDPLKFLEGIHERLNSKGILVLSSNYDWLGAGLKRELWPGGFKKDGEPVTSFDGIARVLNHHFELQGEAIDHRVIKAMSSRTYAFTVNQTTVWKKKV